MKTTDELLNEFHREIVHHLPPYELNVDCAGYLAARAAIVERLDRLAELEAQGIRISDSGELYIVVTARCDQETLKVG